MSFKSPVLDEVELDEQRKVWLITLSFPDEEEKGIMVALKSKSTK